MNDWIGQLARLAREQRSSVLVTVAAIRGSAPREIGAKMLVTANESTGSIGGGQLEYECTRIACELLGSADAGRPLVHNRRIALGANCGQCCGGVVDIRFEHLPRSRAAWLDEVMHLHAKRQPLVLVTRAKDAAEVHVVTAGHAAGCPGDVLAAARRLLEHHGEACLHGDYLLEPVAGPALQIAVFGAGHVGAAVVDVLARTACALRWIDSRRNVFPAVLPDNVTVLETADPAREALAMPAGACYLVMTHSHPLDLEICARVLAREDVAYCGVIGSAAKRRRFVRRLKMQGFLPQRLDDLRCPIGVPGIVGKKPVDIAIAVAAEVLQVRDAGRQPGVKPGYLEALS